MSAMTDTSNREARASGVPIPPDGPPGAPPGIPIPEPDPAPIQPPPDNEPLPGDPPPPPAGDPPSEKPIRLKEVGGPKGPEPTRYGDWERKGRVSDF